MYIFLFGIQKDYIDENKLRAASCKFEGGYTVNRIISVVLSVVMVFGMVELIPNLGQTAYAATEGIYTYTVSESKATITDCDNSASGDITIPSTLGGYPVTYIGDSAFNWCSSLTSVTKDKCISELYAAAY